MSDYGSKSLSTKAIDTVLVVLWVIVLLTCIGMAAYYASL
jgi:hypothetical protein